MTTTNERLTPDVEVRSRRLALGLTVAQLAKQTGCSMSSINNIEAGYVPRYGHVLSRILHALDVAEDQKSIEARAGNADPEETSGAGGGHGKE